MYKSASVSFHDSAELSSTSGSTGKVKPIWVNPNSKFGSCEEQYLTWACKLNIWLLLSFFQYKPPLPGKKASTGSATSTSSAGKSRQGSSKATSEYSSPGLTAGKKRGLYWIPKIRWIWAGLLSRDRVCGFSSYIWSLISHFENWPTDYTTLPTSIIMIQLTAFKLFFVLQRIYIITFDITLKSLQAYWWKQTMQVQKWWLSPEQFTKSINKPLWLQMVMTEIDCNLKNVAKH